MKRPSRTAREQANKEYNRREIMKMVTFIYMDGDKERMTEQEAMELAQKIEKNKAFVISKGIPKEEAEKAHHYQIVRDE